MKVLAVCLLIIQGAVATQPHPASQNLRQPEAVALHALSQPGATVVDLAGLSKPKLMDFINAFRAEICGKLKGEHGRRFESFAKCKEFMEKVCKPGKDKEMDGGKGEISTGKGYCKEYFHEQEVEKELEKRGVKVEKEVEKEEKVADAPVKAAETKAPAPAPAAPVKAPAPAPAAETKAPAPAKAAPAPVASSAPGPAPAPMPAVADEAYYSKDGGNSPERLHMKENLKLPTQGYWGKLVEHDDGKTATGDWGKEFGPRSGHESIKQICQENPKSRWCDLRFKEKSASHRVTMSLAALVMSFAVAVV